MMDEFMIYQKTLFAAVSAITLLLPFTSYALAPIGWLDGIDANGAARGWALDQDTSSQPITVKFYIDGPIGNGTFIGQMVTNASRPDVNAAMNVSGNHGFVWQVPSTYAGVSHQLYVYGVDSSGNDESAQLSGTPQTLTFTNNQRPIGWMDVTASGYTTGWALDPDTPSQSIDVSFYLDGPKGTGIFLGTARTQIPRADVNTAMKVSGDHGYVYLFSDNISNGPHTLYAYGIDTAAGFDGVLNGSPKSFTKSPPFVASPGPQPTKLIDSPSNGYTYGYAPSIIIVNGTWHMYYCSTGNPGWDDVRHATSQDGIHWSAPDDLLKATDMVNERASCDPSVTYFDAGDGPNYYLFYSGNQKDVQTVNFVARSQSPSGPFLKFTMRGTWEANAADPKVILSPLNAAPDVGVFDNPNPWYGLGQPSVVAKGGVLYQWFTDVTRQYPNASHDEIYFATSTNPTAWATRTRTNVADSSIDVKYDAATKQFVMFGFDDTNLTANAHVVFRTSTDGITWSNPTTILAIGTAPPWSNNIGVSGSRTGELMRSSVLVGYGAPYNLVNDQSLGYWDLYGQQIDASLLPAPQQSCTPNWSCSTWNQCSASGTQARACTDFNSCGVVTNKPVESQACTAGFGGVGSGGSFGGGGTSTGGYSGNASIVAPTILPVAQNSTSKIFNSCPKIAKSLSRGSRGADVIALQQFLISQNLLTLNFATDFFGAMTEAAVKKWQEQNGIVSSGTSRTTGYGVAGPKTRAAIARLCESATSTSGTSATAGSYTMPLGIHDASVSFSASSSSATGNAPLTVSFIARIVGDADPNTFYVDFGDGQKGTIQGGGCGPTRTSECSLPHANHTYTQLGTYTAKLKRTIPIQGDSLGTATITVR